MSGNFEGIKTQKFGVEIECTGLARAAAARAIGKVLGKTPEHFGGSYGLWFTIPASDAWTKAVILRREIMRWKSSLRCWNIPIYRYFRRLSVQ